MDNWKPKIVVVINPLNPFINKWDINPGTLIRPNLKIWKSKFNNPEFYYYYVILIDL